MRPLTFTRLLINCFYLAVILFVVMVIALKLGAVPVSLYGLAADLLKVLFHRTSALSSNYDLIVIDIRLPRILLGIVVGASLSVAGTAFQALLRNPLADPYVLGASSGASLGAILTLIVQPYIAIPVAIAVIFTPVGAFVGAAATIAVVYFLGRRDGTLDSNTLLLSGIVSGSFLSAIIMFLMSTLAGRGDLRGILFWLMGDLSTAIPPTLRWMLGAGFLLASGVIYATASDLNLMLNGEKRRCISEWMCRVCDWLFIWPHPS